jgi:uncharacterized protein (DUF362 family)
MHMKKKKQAAVPDALERREFLKLLGYSSLLLSVPLLPGCEYAGVRIPGSAALVKNTDDAYALRRAIQLVDGLSFLKPGDSVLLKLALNSPNPFPATTSPFVVQELVALLKEHGAGDVLVGDKSPDWQDTLNCLKETGIYDAAVSAGARIVVFEDEDMIAVQPEKATRWPGGFSMPKIFQDVDHIIVLPTLRTHQLAGFTMGLKIFVGALPQNDRYAMHRSLYFLESIAEISLGAGNVRLSLLDARQGFNAGGPDSGDLIEPGIMIASTNLAAADAVGLALMKATGTTSQLSATPVWEHPTIRRGIQVHSPGLSAATLTLLSEGVENIAAIKEQLHA